MPTPTTGTGTVSARPECPITYEQGTSILLSHMFSGAIGPAKGKSVSYSLLQETENLFFFIAALQDWDESGKPIDRYQVVINRISGVVQTPEPISLSTTELADAILDGTGHHLANARRFTDGSLSISYKVSVHDAPDEYVLQLRHHGDVSSMNGIMQLISWTIDPHILPIPTVYPLVHEGLQVRKHGMGIQITRFIDGVMGNISYPSMAHEEKLLFLRRLALAFNALWTIPLPEPRLIGELKATNEHGVIHLKVGPDRHHSLGGPFHSVADFLRARIRAALTGFQKQEGIKEYKSRYLQRVTNFVYSWYGQHPRRS